MISKHDSTLYNVSLIYTEKPVGLRRFWRHVPQTLAQRQALCRHPSAPLAWRTHLHFTNTSPPLQEAPITSSIPFFDETSTRSNSIPASNLFLSLDLTRPMQGRLVLAINLILPTHGRLISFTGRLPQFCEAIHRLPPSLARWFEAQPSNLTIGRPIGSQ